MYGMLAHPQQSSANRSGPAQSSERPACSAAAWPSLHKKKQVEPRCLGPVVWYFVGGME